MPISHFDSISPLIIIVCHIIGQLGGWNRGIAGTGTAAGTAARAGYVLALLFSFAASRSLQHWLLYSRTYHTYVRTYVQTRQRGERITLEGGG